MAEQTDTAKSSTPNEAPSGQAPLQQEQPNIGTESSSSTQAATSTPASVSTSVSTSPPGLAGNVSGGAAGLVRIPPNATEQSSTSAPYATASLYVGDLKEDVTETMLYDIFKNVGLVALIRVCRDTATKKSLGYAYVNFHNTADANRAMDTMNYTLINGKPCRIMWSHRDPSRRRNGAGNTFIKNLDKKVNCQQLFDTFSVFGNIISCKVQTDDRGNSKGYGFVHFENVADSQRAIDKVNGMMIEGKTVYVGKFIPRRERLPAGGVDIKEQRFTNVYIKDLDPSVTQEQLRQAFNQFGEITSAVVMKNDDGMSRGFGFVNFKEHSFALAAVRDMHGYQWGTKKLYVCRAQQKSERSREFRRRVDQYKADPSRIYGVNLYVRNLDEGMTDEELRKNFAAFGTITSAKVMRDDRNNPKGFGFVCFSTLEEASRAVSDMNGMLIRGKPLYVAVAQKKEERRQHLATQHSQQRPPYYQYPVPSMVYPQVAMMPNHQYAMPPTMYPQNFPYRRPHVRYPNTPLESYGPRQQSRGRNINRPMNQSGQQKESMANVGKGRVPSGAPAVSVRPLSEIPKFAYSSEDHLQDVGEFLFNIVGMKFPSDRQRTGKITGMILESYHNELDELVKLFDDPNGLDKKINEANNVYERANEGKPQ